MKKLLLSLAMLLPLFGFATEVTDVLTADNFTATSTGYTDFTGVEGASGAVYAGQTAKSTKGFVQLRATNPSGIVTTASGGNAKKVVITWSSESASGRTIDVYGKATAYETGADIYDNKKQGTKIGSIVYGTSTELEVEGDYTFIGIRSNKNALMAEKIQIVWEQVEAPAVAKVVFSAPAGEYYSGKAVELTCATEDATILYSLDGSEPATEYSEPIVLTETTTIKAVAVKGEDKGEAVEATYTIAPSFGMISEVHALANNAKFTYTGNLRVLYSNAKAGYIYVCNEYEEGTLIYDKASAANLAEGNYIEGPINATVSIFNGCPQVVPAETLVASESEEIAISTPWPLKFLPDNVENFLEPYYIHKPVVIEGVNFAGFKDREGTVKVGDTDVAVYNQFNLDKFPTGRVDINGFLNFRSKDNVDTYRVLPIAINAAKYPLYSTPATQTAVEEVYSIIVGANVDGEDVAVALNEDCEENVTVGTWFGPMEVTVNTEIVDVEGVNKLLVSLEEAITDEGTYVITIPEGFLNVGELGLSKATEIVLSITKPVEPVELSVNPEAGTVDDLKVIEILAEGIQDARAGNNLDGEEITISNEAGDVVYTADSFELNNNCFDWDTWSFLGYKLNANITEAGTYTLNIPEGYFEFANMAKSLPLTAVYTIEGPAAPAVETKVVILNGNNLDSNKASVRKGLAGTDAEGFTLAMAGGKTLDNVTSTDMQFKIDGASYMPMKNSAKQQITCTLPEGMLAKSITIYSYTNDNSVYGYWSEVAGQPIAEDATNHNAFKTAEYDVNTFEIPDLNEFTFTGLGKQMCFVLKVEYYEPAAEPEAPEALYLKSSPSASTIAVLEQVEEGIYAAENVEFEVMAEGEAWFSIYTNEDGTGTHFGAQYDGTYAETAVPNFMVEDAANSWNVIPGTYNITLNWEEKCFNMEKVGGGNAEGNVRIYFDNSNGNLAIPTIVYMAGFGGMNQVFMTPVGGSEIAPLSVDESNLWSADIPAEIGMFAFCEGDEDAEYMRQYVVVDDDFDPVSPVANTIYQDAYTDDDEGEYYAQAVGTYEGGESNDGITIYWHNIDNILAAPAVFYFTDIENALWDIVEAEETAVENVWKATVPANTEAFIFTDGDAEIVAMILGEDDEDNVYLTPVDGMVYAPEEVPYGSGTEIIASEEGYFDALFGEGPEALYIKTSAEANAIAVLEKGEGLLYTAEEVEFYGVEDDFAFFQIFTSDEADAEYFGAAAPGIVAQNGVAYEMAKGIDLSWNVINGTYNVTVDWGKKTVTLVNAAGETGNITIYFDNTRAQMDRPAVQVSDFSMMNEALIEMERCADLPEDVAAKVRARATAGDHAMMDYNVFKAEVPSDYIIWGFIDLLNDEDMVPIADEDYMVFVPSGIVYDENGEVVGNFEDVVTGVEGIEAEASEAVYYNLQGVRVENPESGLYIVVRNGKVSKELLK